MTIFDIHPPRPDEYSAMYYQRWLVLREPLGMPLGSEQDRFDEQPVQHNCHYAIATTEDMIVGSARLRPIKSEVASIAYVAVLPEFSRRGIGTKLIEHCCDTARQNQWHTICIRSRTSAQDFYTKLGFKATTKPFTFMEIPHIDMQLRTFL